MQNKSHYRKVRKTPHLGVADLEEYQEEGMKSFIFTVKEVKQFIYDPKDKNSGVVVGGRRGSHNIVFWTNPKIKPWALNATNETDLKGFFKSSFVDDWNNLTIELYIKNGVRSVSGGTTDGIRIQPILPVAKVKQPFTDEHFEAAHKNKATLESIKKHYTVTKEIEEKFKSYGAKK